MATLPARNTNLTPGTIRLARMLFMGAAGIMTCLGLFFVVMGGREWYRAAISQSWPHVTGRVVDSGVARSTHSSLGRGTRHTRHQADIEYQYQVDGTAYTGTRVTFTVAPTSQEAASAIAAAYPKDATPEIYYNPSDPSECVLQPGWDWGNLIPVGAGAFAVAFSALFIYLTQRMTRVMLKVVR